MKITYETGTATLIQLIVLGLLNILTAIDSTITACKTDDCLGSFFINFIFYVVLVVWFVSLSVLGYAAQQKRSRRLAQILIAAEALVAIVALFDAKHHNDILGLLTSVADLVLAVWIIRLAFRLMRAGGGRVVVKQRARQRRKSTS
jgi:hypothetical protein